MAHPYQAHKQSKVEHSRVSRITRGYATGGSVLKGSTDDDSKVRKISRSLEREVDAEGGISPHRMDRPKRAKGGKVGKSKGNSRTIVNVITGGHPAGGALPPGPPMAPPGPPMGIAPAAAMPPPRPPMAPPMGPGGPPPMPMRANGGRIIKRADGGMAEDPADEMRRLLQSPAPDDKATPQQSLAKMRRLLKEGTTQRAKGGRVNQGTKVFEQSKRSGTPVTHDDGKADLVALNRPRVVTFRFGGKVKRAEASDAIAPATELPGGSGGGEARLAKAHRAGRKN